MEKSTIDIVERLRDITRPPPTREEAADYIKQLEKGNRLHLELAEIKEAEIERLREALRNVLSVQPIKGDEGSTDIISLAKALLEIDTIARDALKEKE